MKKTEVIISHRIILALLLAVGILLLGDTYVQRAAKEHAVYTMGQQEDRPVVLLDAGHGGMDGGAISSNGALEKEINLSIAQKLKRLLEQNDVAVVMTREEDKDLASEHASNRKNEDLRARIALLNETEPALMVSIHQNSYPEEDVDGAQVFYYSGSPEGKLLGGMVQESLKREIADGNHRVAKGNKDYYLLKKSTCPAVIVECGFLSNPAEAALLATEEYQEKIAFAIHLGILEYLNCGVAAGEAEETK